MRRAILVPAVILGVFGCSSPVAHRDASALADANERVCAPDLPCPIGWTCERAGILPSGIGVCRTVSDGSADDAGAPADTSPEVDAMDIDVAVEADAYVPCGHFVGESCCLGGVCYGALVCVAGSCGVP